MFRQCFYAVVMAFFVVMPVSVSAEENYRKMTPDERAAYLFSIGLDAYAMQCSECEAKEYYSDGHATVTMPDGVKFTISRETMNETGEDLVNSYHSRILVILEEGYGRDSEEMQTFFTNIGWDTVLIAREKMLRSMVVR
jgi:ribosomal protein S4E